MSDRFNPGDFISADKLNRASAATAQISYSGPGQFTRSGSAWSIGEAQSDSVESFWVSCDEETSQTYTISQSSTVLESRTVYRYSWSEVRFDKTYGLWIKTGRRGDAGCDPLMNYDPTQKIPLTETPAATGFCSLPTVKTVYPVVREPNTGQLFFFS